MVIGMGLEREDNVAGIGVMGIWVISSCNLLMPLSPAQVHFIYDFLFITAFNILIMTYLDLFFFIFLVLWVH